MRFYSFVNMYFIGIHAGIQTAHAVHQMETDYRNRIVRRSRDFGSIHAKKCLEEYRQWSENHKTIIVKNGGTQDSLLSLYESLLFTLKHTELYCPTILWREPSANDCVTAVGIVVPASVYEAAEPVSYGNAPMVDPAWGNKPLTAPWSEEYKLRRILDGFRMAS